MKTKQKKSNNWLSLNYIIILTEYADDIRNDHSKEILNSRKTSYLSIDSFPAVELNETSNKYVLVHSFKIWLNELLNNVVNFHCLFSVESVRHFKHYKGKGFFLQIKKDEVL